MSKIDERVVGMKFNNSQFEQGIKTSMGSLDSLKSKLNMTGASKGLENLNVASKNVDLSSLGASVDNISSRFSAMSVVAITAIASIAHQATAAGIGLVKSFSVDPISEGFSDYNAKLTSVQTIMSATGASIEKVDGYFRQLDEYSDKTIYNLRDMTGAFAKFTNAGIKMETSVPAIKGIANMVALAGQDANAAAIAFYNIPQSLNAGFLTSIDYKSLNLANVATKEWRDQVIAAAVSAGKLKKIGKDAFSVVAGKAGNSTDAAGLFNAQLKEGWASSEVLLKVFKDYGDITTAIGRKAQAAAQNVKSIPMMFETLRAAVGTGWTDTFEVIFGNVTEATKLWTGLTNTIGGFLEKISLARNNPLKDWKKLGGQLAAVDAIKFAFQALMSIIKPIIGAFKHIFPAKTGKQFADVTKTIRDFMKSLILGKDSATKLNRTFVGIFAVLDIGFQIIKGVAKLFFSFFSVIGAGVNPVLTVTSFLGKLIERFQELAHPRTGKGGIEGFFDKLINAKDKILIPLIAIISKLANSFIAFISPKVTDFVDLLFETFSKLSTSPIAAFFNQVGEAISVLMTGNFSGFLDKLGGSFSFLAPIVDVVRTSIINLSNRLGGISSAVLTPIIDSITKLSDKFKSLGDSSDIPELPEIKFDLMSSDTATGEMTKLQVAGEALKSVWEGIKSFFTGIGGFFGPIFTSIGNLFTTISDKLSIWIKDMDMTDGVALLNTGAFIAMYLGIKKFADNVGGAITDFMNAASNILDEVTKSLKTMQQDIKVNMILKIAIAVGILAASLYVLAQLEPARLAAALGGVAALLIMLTVTLKSMLGMTEEVEGGPEVKSKKLLAAGGALILMATAILILSHAVQNLAELEPAKLAMGLAAVGALLASLTLFTKFAVADEGAMKAGAGLVLLAIAIKMLVGSVALLGNMKREVLGQGLASLGLIIIGMIAVVRGFSDTTGIVKAAAGMLILSGALIIMSFAIKLFAGIDPIAFITGLSMIGLTLFVIAAAMQTMPDDMPKMAAGLLILSGALFIISQVIQDLGAMEGKDLAQGVVTLGLALAAMVIALKALTGPTVMIAAQALLIVSAALYIFGKTIELLSSISEDNLVKALMAIVSVFVILGVVGLTIGPILPVLAVLAVVMLALGIAMQAAGIGFLMFAAGFALFASVGAAGIAVAVAGFTAFTNMIPLFASQLAMGVIAFAAVISRAGPRITQAIVTLLMSFMNAIITVTPKIAQTFLTLLAAFLIILVQAIPMLVRAGYELITGLLRGIGDNIGKLIIAGADLIVNFLNGLAAAYPRVIEAGTNLIVNYLQGLADNLPRVITAGRNLIVNFLNGLAEALPDIINAGVNLIAEFIIGIGQGSVDLVDAALDTVIIFIDGLTTAIDEHAEEIGTAAGRLMVALGDGLRVGIGAAIREVANNVGGPMGFLLGQMADALGVASPSTKTTKMGMYLVDGLGVGLNKYSSKTTKAAENVGHSAIDAMRKSLTGISDIGLDSMDIRPTITPVLDLTDVEKNSGLVGSMLATQPIAVGATYSNAQDVSTGYSNSQVGPVQMRKDIQAITAALAANPTNTNPVPPRAVEFHIDTIQDGDSLLRRARATNKMLSLAEGGDSTQIARI